MNFSGMLRGYMSKNMKAEEFIEVVRKALSREFEEDVKLEKTDNIFTISLKNYHLSMTEEFIEEIQSLYGVDRFVLDEFKKQGFEFDKNRSQYIQYCYGVFCKRDNSKYV